MKKISKKISFFFIVNSLLLSVYCRLRRASLQAGFLFTAVAHAEDVKTEVGSFSGGDALVNYLKTLYDSYLIGIGTALAVIMLIWSGIQYITSSGNPEGIEAAKNRVLYTITGYILLLLVGTIYRFLIK